MVEFNYFTPLEFNKLYEALKAIEGNFNVDMEVSANEDIDITLMDWIGECRFELVLHRNRDGEFGAFAVMESEDGYWTNEDVSFDELEGKDIRPDVIVATFESIRSSVENRIIERLREDYPEYLLKKLAKKLL